MLQLSTCPLYTKSAPVTGAYLLEPDFALGFLHLLHPSSISLIANISYLHTNYCVSFCRFEHSKMGVTGALLYGLYKLTNRNDESTTPETKVLPPDVPVYQPDRHVQNVSIIPDGAANITEAPRDVYIASRIIMGGRGDGAVGMIDKYGLGAIEAWATDGLSEAFNDVPSPFHHWCVVVGDYLHQLQSTSFSKGWNYYTNEKYGELAGWTKYKVGVTNFNDIAVRNAGMFDPRQHYHAQTDSGLS